MKNRQRSRNCWIWAAPVALALFVAACSPRAAGTPAPPFELTNQQGEMVSLSQFRGQVVALTFLYTHCPDTCPLYIAQIKQAISTIPALQDKVAVVAVTVDPERDTVARLKEYAGSWPPNWHFLTGTPGQLKTVWDNYGIFVQKGEKALGRPDGGEKDYEVIHTGRVVLIDSKGNKVSELRGNWTPEELAQKLKALAAGQPVSRPSLGQAAVGFLYNCGSVVFQNLGQAVIHAVVALAFLGSVIAMMIRLWR